MRKKISDIAILVVISLSVFLGMFYFMYDIAYYGDGTQKYNLTVPTSAEGNATALLREMNATARELESSLTGSQSWTQTAYNIFFSLPQSIISTTSTIANTGSKLVGIATGPEAKMPVPDWVIIMVYVLIAIIIVTTFFYVVMGRDI